MLDARDKALCQPVSSAVLRHLDVRLGPDPARVLLRSFRPTAEPRDRNAIDKPRANHIVDRIIALPTDVAGAELDSVLARFASRHRSFLERLDIRAADLEAALEPHAVLTVTQRRLVGAYFLNEYSFESVALFNPSIVAHPDQSAVPKDGCRIILPVQKGQLPPDLAHGGVLKLVRRVRADQFQAPR